MQKASLRLFAASTLVSTLLLLSACGGGGGGSTSSGNDEGNSGGNETPQTTLSHRSGNSGVAETQGHFDQIISASDGEDVAFSVFVPNNTEGAPVPLVIHGHGFGLSRIKDFDDPNPVSSFASGDVSGDVSRRLWEKAGYYVISFDQRGFGESSGDITVMDPELDCDNISRMIDWAEQNLPNLGYRDSDPVIGAIGLSYGGGFQTVCSSTDKRFDAIVPMATWSHLPYSLYANQTPKNIWLDLLAVASQGKLAPYLIQGFIEATTTGDISDEIIDELATHGPRAFCQGQMATGLSTADALFIQGSHDVLFNLNEAIENYECWKANGQDTHLLIQRDGHIVPALQTAGAQILFGTDEQLYCDEQVLNTREIAADFLISKLSGSAANFRLPDICFSLAASQQGTTFAEVPRGGQLRELPPSQVIPGGLSSLANLLQNIPLTTLLNTLSALPVETLAVVQQVATGLADPASLADSADDIVNLLPEELIVQLVAPAQFIPLETMTSSATLAGIPLASLILDGGNGEDTTLYIGLGRIPAGGGNAQLINDQVLPITGTGSLLVEMIGVSEQVNSGDTLGLMVYGFHPYFLHGAAIAQPPLPTGLAGTIDLPLVQ